MAKKPPKPVDPNRIPRGQTTLIDNTEWIRGHIKDSPERVFTHVGKVLAKEVRTEIPKNTKPQYTPKGNLRTYKTKTGKVSKRPRGSYLSSKVTYWARKRDMDLQIGFKDNNMSHEYNYDRVEDSLKPTIVRNKDLIWKLFYEAMEEINKK